MACIYIYKGHTFNSELELDDFLLENKQFEPILGDAVFSRTSAQNDVSSKLSIIAKDSVELNKKYREWEEQKKIIYTEDGDESFEQPPYIGVNKFLSGLVNSDNVLLFPEFREEEYWSRRYSHWKLGEYTDAEIDEFQFNKDNPPKVVDSEQHKKMRDQMTHKWEIQAKTGTAIHNILQLCFSKVKDNYAITQDDTQLKQYIQNNISKKNKQYINDIVISQGISYARNLYKDLTYKFGDDILLYPEFTVSQNTNVIHNGTPTKLLGIIDLLIIDRDGKAHILDYKTSIHGYEEFSIPKKTAYSYQLAVYQRMLQKYGINTSGGQLLVAPIKIEDFKKNGDDYSYSGISYPDSFLSITTSFNTDKMWENIDEFMPVPFKLSITANQVNQTVTDVMSHWFRDNSNLEKVTRESVIEKLKRYNKLKPNENGLYTWKRYGKNEEPITATSEAEFVDKVFKYEESRPANRIRYTQEVKNALKEGIRNGINNADFPTPRISNTQGEVTWLKDILSKYCDGNGEGNWEVRDNELTEAYGIIILETKEGIYPRQVDFIRVSTNDLYQNYRKYLDKGDPIKNRKGLTGTFEADIVQKSKSNSLMAEAINGNIELMETMLIINQLSGLQGSVIGNVVVVNPIDANGVQLRNKQLLYCFNELNKHYPVKNNRIGLGDREIKFATDYELLLNDLNFILRSGDSKQWRDEYRNLSSLRSAKSIMDLPVDSSAEEKIRAIYKLIKTLEINDRTRAKLSRVYTKESDLQSKEVSLYNQALLAVAQLRGIDFKQQLEDHDKWLESVIIWREGISGSMIDNPGNLDSETLNLATKLVTEAYQNTRDDVQRNKDKIFSLVNKLKKEKSFGFVKENTIGNQINLYSNMYETTPDGDFVFKNPNRLVGSEREFLEYALNIINKNRFPDKTQEELDKMKNSDDAEYYRVPLAIGGADSTVSTQGLMSMLRSKLSYMLPQKAFEIAQKKIQGIFNAEEEYNRKNSQLLYQMTNYFDGGEGTKRLDKIKSIGIENLEHNLETLLLKHIFAYSVKENVDSIFPMLKAATIHISMQGAMKNTQFKNDQQYMTNYIKNKVLNQSIVDEKDQKWVNKVNVIKNAASTLTLAFAPVQALYQPLQGLWTDISLMIRKPDGKQSFTKSNFMQSLKIVYSDLAHFSDIPTVCSAVNETYGINDMDMNTYIDRISSGKRGIWNFDGWMYKFSSRPDYYNRMSIFIAQMLGDGCYEAHYINSDGKLVYDWTRDKRFSKFAANPTLNTSDPEYNRQKALYYAMATQFEREHTKNNDGKEFKVNMKNPMPLPRAYTTQEAESMKSLGDDIYGYYSHEKKSLVMSTALGSMWLQFKTYWSSKKNQYLQSGGVRLKGKWEHLYEVVEDPDTHEKKKVYYYYQVDKDGNIQYDLPPITEQTSAPFMQWKGLWQEGIILTLSDMVKTMIDQRSFIKGWNSKWNSEDEGLRQAYRNNIKQFGFDTMMFVLGGVILGSLLSELLKDLLKDSKKNTDLSTGLALAVANIAIMSVKNSFLDFNFIESIGSPVGQWTPFSFEWGQRTLSNWWNVAVGDEDFWDGVIKTSGGLKQIKPVLDSIKPEMFRTESEGGTFGKD